MNMKRLTIICIFTLLSAAAVVAQPRRVTSMDAGWRFHLGDVADAQMPAFSDGDWRKLNVPHDWSIEGENLRDNPGGGSIGFFPIIFYLQLHFSALVDIIFDSVDNIERTL